VSADPYKIDGHKLHLHPRRVGDWLAGEDIAPVYMEISPSGACNHRCVFCGLDFMEYRRRFLPTDLFCRRLAEMGEAGERGVRAIMYAGEGEPFLHRDMPAIAQATKNAGMDVAFTTNASLLTPEKARQVLPVTSWIKVSCNAGTPETYARIHGTKEAEFHKVLRNMEDAVRIRLQTDSACTLGAQMVLLPENRAECVLLARRARDMGLDYLVIKPYSHHPQSHTRAYAEVEYSDCAALAQELEACSSPGFDVIFRHNTMLRHAARHKGYSQCLALPFWAYVDAGGDLWGCSVFLGDDRFHYGNILEAPFAQAWQGPQRQAALRRCQESLDASRCRSNCRMDAVNTYLWELTHPHPHSNFI